MSIWIRLVTLPTIHCMHQPLDVSCFEHFKTTFRKKKNDAMVRNNSLK